MSTRRSFRLLVSILVVLSLTAGPARAEPGGPDEEFGDGGQVVLASQPGASAVTVQADGRIVVAGSESGDLYVMRLLPDGSPDLSFGPGGQSTAPALQGQGAVADVFLDRDDRIVVVGSFGSAGGVLRLLRNGQPDPTFDRDGLATPPELQTRAAAAIQQPDGGYVVAALTGSGYTLVRLSETDGRRDVSFGPLEEFLPDVYFADPQLVSLGGAGVLVVAAVTCFPDCGSNLLVAAYDGRGKPSARFGGKPSVRLDYGANDTPVAAGTQPDGSIVVGLQPGRVVRLTTDGRTDPTWGTCGVASVEAGASQPAHVLEDLEVLGDSSVVAVGWAGSDLFLARLRPDGVADQTFGPPSGPPGQQIVDAGGQDRLLAVAAAPHGRLIGAGVTGGEGLVLAVQGYPQPQRRLGYVLAAADGGTFAFGGVQFEGSAGCLPLNRPVVGIARTPSGNGYWLVASDGGIFAFGDAAFHGSTGAMVLNRPIVGMSATPSGNGYWLVASDGGIFAFGDAEFHGSTGAIVLNSPIVGMERSPRGDGYWLVAGDGGIFAFGDAPFHGSTGALALNRPIVGMTLATTPDSDGDRDSDGHGYWLVASDGGIFAFGHAGFHGSTGAMALNRPIVGMATAPGLRGYWLVASDGGIFAFGHAVFAGSTGGIALNQPVVGMVAM